MMSLTLVVYLALGTSEAAPPRDPSVEIFKQSYAAGEKAFSQGRFKDAVIEFRSAHVVKQTPEVAYDLAKCYEKLTDTALAIFYYRQYLRLDSAATDRKEVEQQISAWLTQSATTSLGYVEMDVPGARQIQFDSKSVPGVPWAKWIKEGSYPVSFQVDQQTYTQTATVTSGKVSAISIDVPARFEPVAKRAELEPVENTRAVAAAPTPLETSIAVDTLPANQRTLRTASYVTMGGAAVALVAGTVFGVVAARNGNIALNNTLLSPAEQQNAANVANTQGTIANGLWISGAVAVVAGATLYVFSIPHNPSSTEAVQVSP